MRYLVALLALSLSGCVTMGKKEYVKNQELWQSVGRMSGIIECQQALLQVYTEKAGAEKPKQSKEKGK
jgi:hypothetical protein